MKQQLKVVQSHCYKYGQINIKGGYSTSNSAVNGKGGFAYLSECQLYVLIHEYAISSNRALNGGGIYANKSIIWIGHITTMTNNSAARDGGALYLTDDSEIRFHFTVQSHYLHLITTWLSAKVGQFMFQMITVREFPTLPNVSFVTLVTKTFLCLLTTVLIRVQLSTEDYWIDAFQITVIKVVTFWVLIT